MQVFSGSKAYFGSDGGKRAGRCFSAAPSSRDDQLLDTSEVASWWTLSSQFMQRLRRRNLGPTPTRLGRSFVRYRYSDLISYIRLQTLDPASYRGLKTSHVPIPVKLQIDKRARDLIESAQGHNPNDFYTSDQLSAWWGVSRSHLERARHAGYGPKFVKFSRNRVLYRRGDLLQFLRERAAAYISDYEREVLK